MIITYPSKMLRTPTAQVTIGSGFDMEEVDHVVDCMIHDMYLSKGLGLAANQIGEDKRIFIYDDDGDPKVMINPEVEMASNSNNIDDESCLSVPFFSARIRRANDITVGAEDEYGVPFVVHASGLTARIFQHELDHLNGILILDRVSQLHRERYRKDLKRRLRRAKKGGPK